jgi:hypothetical protein
VQDIILSLFLFCAAMVMLVVSAVNLNAILISSGELVFLESPWKAWMISVLAPLSSICIKLVPLGFEFPQTKKLFLKFLYSLTALAIILWMVLIAQTFQGMGGDLDVDALLESGQNSQLYVFTQLCVEILVAASLFSGWQSLLDNYHPAAPSTDSIALDKRIATSETVLEAAQKRLGEATQNLEAIKTGRQLFINKQIEKLSLLKAKNHFIQQFFGEQK